MPCNCQASSCPECMGGYVPNEQPFEGAYRSALKLIKSLEAHLAEQTVRLQEVEAELAVTNKLLADRQRLLEAIPPCPAHGPCIPHALQWIEYAKKRIAGITGGNVDETSHS